jgi:hypothetical protein
METASDNRFDANFVGQILLQLAHEQSMEKLLQKLVDGKAPHGMCSGLAD